jgi:predicted naringenin-chalcone synthase
MRKVTTVYTCDGCGETLEAARDLRKFVLEKPRSPVLAVAVEVCASCETQMLAAMERFVSDEHKATLLDMGRNA